MRILVTGGAGFIGRWLVKRLLDDNHRVITIDDLSNGRLENIREFKGEKRFEFIQGDIRNLSLLKNMFKSDYDIIYHLAAEINVQKSLNNPVQTFQRDVIGSFNLLEKCRLSHLKFIFVSSCMVYDRSFEKEGISESHPVKPTSPYAAAKLSGEFLTLSYYYSYELPIVILRPFNTYGPYQKTTGEGGVVAIFLEKVLNNQPLNIYGTGEQTRDLLYVDDCVDFILKAGESETALGQVINAGTGKDISINKLAELIVDDPILIKHVPHIHPQSEIMKLKCDYSKARNLLNWEPKFDLEEGLELTKTWISSQLS